MGSQRLRHDLVTEQEQCNIWDILILKLYSLSIWFSGLTRHSVFYMANLYLPHLKVKILESLTCMPPPPYVNQSYPASLLLPQQASHFLQDANTTHGPGPPTLGRQSEWVSPEPQFITLLRETSLPGSLSPHPPVSCAQPVTPRLDAFLESPYLPGLYKHWSSLATWPLVPCGTTVL